MERVSSANEEFHRMFQFNFFAFFTQAAATSPLLRLPRVTTTTDLVIDPLSSDFQQVELQTLITFPPSLHHRFIEFQQEFAEFE